MSDQRIYLSPPHVDLEDHKEVLETLKSGWVAPVGPAIDTFEEELSKNYEGREVVALNSGTSALHLALVLAGVGSQDDVLVSSFTFAACANVVHYLGATPVFIDSEKESWNMDPELLSTYLSNCDQLPKALIVTHLYGMPAKIKRIVEVSKQYGITVIEDAAEALGASIRGKAVGSFGDYGVLSFNGNKIITTSGGGALICKEGEKYRAIHLATQANKGSYSYDHHEVGYNYRMSNVLAGLGLSQLRKLDLFIQKKREIHARYEASLGDSLEFLPEPNECFSNRWLTTATLKNHNRSVVDLIQFLETKNIESRMLWKPLHVHPAYCGFDFLGDGVCEKVFEKGICLPSGTGLTDDEQSKVIETVRSWLQS